MSISKGERQRREAQRQQQELQDLAEVQRLLSQIRVVEYPKPKPLSESIAIPKHVPPAELFKIHPRQARKAGITASQVGQHFGSGIGSLASGRKPGRIAKRYLEIAQRPEVRELVMEELERNRKGGE